MPDQSSLKQRIENHGLIAIALGLVLIYWIFDSMVTDQYILRLLVVTLIATYSVLTQHLINTRKDAEKDLKKSQDAFEHEIDVLKSEINQLKKNPSS
ncbi:MAG TPA: hypothetical protein PLR20_07010 [Syntrophales bacterium]|nr:hypothetical protein [Syntrophales bacterium]HOX93257.1 hypothetical protein [Syntrophales bacterium]HPI56269.1 hypothetical protein [Syntrophales bacterium]HPN24456.1 hypothetical protein [Syntrophales bacterium]HQM29086.1 hypothetical protein [Syntrophales bacterium]